MRRTHKKGLINLILFGSAAIILLYITKDTADSISSHYDWTTIRYQTLSTDLPAPRGRCPGLKESGKPALVVARIAKEDRDWLTPLEKKYHVCAYTADASDSSSYELQVPANRGHESMAYLTFLIDNYNEIPDEGAVFVHGTRFAWHNDHPKYDNTVLLSALNISAATAGTGYHNMRCDWSAGTCSSYDIKPQNSLETRSRAVLEPYNQRVVSDAALPGAIATLFGGRAAANDIDVAKVLLGRKDIVRAQCCAQFVVSRQSVHQHSREEYFALRQWLLDGMDKDMRKLSKAAPADDRIAGRIVSYLWHILFLQQPAHEDLTNLDYLNQEACPYAEACYCKLYGRCNLECLNKGRCTGQYSIPLNYKVKEQDHSQTHRDESL